MEDRNPVIISDVIYTDLILTDCLNHYHKVYHLFLLFLCFEPKTF